jgi:hypothetical protein
MFGDSDLFANPARIIQNMPSPAATYKVDNRYGFAPGDLVIADIDGVVVVPQAVESEAIRRAWAKVHAENVTRDAIKAGMKAVAAYEKYGVL